MTMLTQIFRGRCPRPGAEITLFSTTKYLGGHRDVQGGAHFRASSTQGSRPTQATRPAAKQMSDFRGMLSVRVKERRARAINAASRVRLSFNAGSSEGRKASSSMRLR